MSRLHATAVLALSVTLAVPAAASGPKPHDRPAASPHHGDDHARGHVIHVKSTLHGEQPLEADTTQCVKRGGEFVPGPLDSAYNGTSVYHGTFEGTGTYCGYIPPGVNHDGTLNFIETDTFTGTVAGCGTGTVTYDVHGTSDVVPDPSRAALPAREHWQILRGSGTGGLAHLVAGKGDDPAKVNLTPTSSTPPKTTVDADFQGVVRCLS